MARSLYFVKVVRVLKGDDLDLPPHPDERTTLNLLLTGETRLPGGEALPLPEGLTIALEPFGRDEAGHLIAMVYLPRVETDEFMPK